MNNTFHFKKKKQNKKITHEINLSDTNGGWPEWGYYSQDYTKKAHLATL